MEFTRLTGTLTGNWHRPHTAYSSSSSCNSNAVEWLL